VQKVIQAALNEQEGFGLSGNEFNSDLHRLHIADGKSTSTKIFRGVFEQEASLHIPSQSTLGFLSEQSTVPDVSVIIPAYHEEETISEVLHRLIKVSGSLGKVEIIVVDDGSTDRTGEKVAAYPFVKYIRHERNMGKGAAVRTGIENSRGRILVIQDADLEYLPDCLPSLVKPITAWEMDIVYGSRFMNKPEGMSFSHFVGNLLLSLVARFLYKERVTDIMTGQKAFRRSVFDSVELRENGFAVEVELTCLGLNSADRRFAEVPVPYSYRKFGVSKIGFFDGVQSLVKMLTLFIGTSV
jgi:glycosyltransferase involved in cell wall biosynthesis